MIQDLDDYDLYTNVKTHSSHTGVCPSFDFDDYRSAFSSQIPQVIKVVCGLFFLEHPKHYCFNIY